jgi:hypothetical protein
MVPGVEIPARPARVIAQPELFEDGHAYCVDTWRGMPEFNMSDAQPQYKITLNFLTAADIRAFAERSGINVTTRSVSAWFPEQPRMDGQLYYGGPKTDSRYPVCIPSKGRADCQTTGALLDRLGVTHRFFVEETEYDEYVRHVGAARVVRLPFHDLGAGSIPARNYIWDWAEANGHRRHWVVDDNIRSFARMHCNRRLIVRGGGFFAAMEDFADRYVNVALAGPHDRGFVKDRGSVRAPYLLNSRVYSCILVDTSVPHRWRGRYNEDTDLSLRVLKDGYCTLLFHALLMSKNATVGAKRARPMKGGNTDHVYTDGDYRRSFAESLAEQHPDCVRVTWKFNRWHHRVDYSRFKKNALIPRAGVVLPNAANNYGMALMRRERTAAQPVEAR